MFEIICVILFVDHWNQIHKFEWKIVVDSDNSYSIYLPDFSRFSEKLKEIDAVAEAMQNLRLSANIWT